MRKINPPKTRLARVAVGRFAKDAKPVGIVTLVVPADLPTDQIIDRAFGIIRRDLGVPGMALQGTVVSGGAA